MKQQLTLFLTALMFYTRIPVPKWVPWSEEILNRSTRYLPLVGLLVGGIGSGVFAGLQQLFPVHLSLILSMLATIFVTGAFHEDGFADFCDGFGGGYTREKILTIMKDSRIGTYGSIGLTGMLATKFAGLISLTPETIPFALLSGHAFSRLMPVIVIFTSSYSRDDATSKTKPVGKRSKSSDLLIAIALGLAPLSLFPWQIAATAVPVCLLIYRVFKRYLEKKIGGYTGDCLGALQQISEVTFYLILVIFYHFS